MDELTWNTVLLVVLLVLVFVGAHYATKYLSGRAKRSAQGGYMRVKDSMLLGRDKQLVLLEVGSKVYLLGITGQTIGLIGTLDGDDLAPLAEQEETVSAFSGFRDVLQRVRAQGKDMRDDQHVKRSRVFARGKADKPPKTAQGPYGPDDIDFLLQAVREKNAKQESTANEERNEP